jgi:hypothetical protein
MPILLTVVHQILHLLMQYAVTGAQRDVTFTKAHVTVHLLSLF